MRKKDLRVVGKPSAERHYVLPDSGSEAGILRKSQQSSDCCDAQSNETPRAKVAEVAAGKRMLELKNKKDTGIHKKGSPKSDSESGRSMVETLGVLAIMGLLAIGGIIGYRWAMDKYRATDTINELNRRAIVHSTQLMTTQTLNALEFPEQTRQGYGVETSPLNDEKAGYFEIALNGVEGGVCREILKADWVWPILKRANGIEYDGDTGICRTDTGVRMAFVFPGDLSGKEGDFRQRCEKDADCRSGCGICEGGYCESQCGEGTTCARTYDNADFYACCMNEKILNGICCPMISNGRCCASIGSCCPSERPLMDKDGNCHECGEENPVNVTGNTVMCGICDGQEGRTKRELNGNTCVLPCPPETPLMDSSGNCHRCDEYKHISVVNSTKCLSVCDGSDDDIHMERTWFGGYAHCVYPCADNEVTASLGSEPCYPCTRPSGISITFRSAEECITKCDGSSEDRPKRRRLAYSNGHSVCMLDECPATHPIQDQDGTCHACTDTRIAVAGVEENCFKCPNRALRGTICVMADQCPKGTHVDDSGKCVCDDPKQVQDRNGNCYPCNSNTIIDVTGVPENCDVCQGDRVAKVFYAGVTKCMKPCADDEFYTSSGCIKCDDPTPRGMPTQGEYCLHCDGQEGRAKRICLGPCHVCALECSAGMVMAGDGTCHTCDEVDPFDVGSGLSKNCTQACAGQRYLVGERCYKCPPDTYSPDSKQCVACPINKENLTREGDCLACGGMWSGSVCR